MAKKFWDLCDPEGVEFADEFGGGVRFPCPDDEGHTEYHAGYRQRSSDTDHGVWVHGWWS